jgi:hypothetical protein
LTKQTIGDDELAAEGKEERQQAKKEPADGRQADDPTRKRD